MTRAETKQEGVRMSGQHTPGPWTMDGLAIDGADGYQVAEASAWDTPYDSLDGFARSHEEAEANARLIAAAPAMLEALTEARAMLVTLLDEHDPQWATQMDGGMEQVEVIDAAIAAAKGEGK